MSYNFKKLQLKSCPSVVGWYLSIEAFEELIDFRDRSIGPIFDRIFREDVSVQKSGGHYTDLSHPFAFMSDAMGKSVPEILGNLQNEVTLKQAEFLRNGYTIYINSSLLGYSFDINNSRYNVLEEINSEKLIFPSNKNVRYLQWNGGKHWYAKVGDMDIYDKLGNMKWDTREDAERVVREYLE